MSDTSNIEADFIERAETIVLENLSNEQFGVSELAEVMNMSRSNLLRKIKKQTQLSASQFIRIVRLSKSMEMLKETSLTVSEVSHQVGFGSTSYFIKCFRDQYGHPPGELAKSGEIENSPEIMPSRQRQLAAIMFTDIEGYTALMQQDESQAIAFRERHREIFEFTTEKFNGRILQYYGDGTLSTFSSTIDAVQCAIDMQLAFFKEEPIIPIRIGIHSGDIIVTEQDIIGNGVNIAARIESLAQTGSVYISEKVYDEIKNQPELLTASMGIHTLKNVSKPMEVYAVFNQELGPVEKPVTDDGGKNGFRPAIAWSLIAVAVLLIAGFAYSSGVFDTTSGPDSISVSIDKSIAVLPFKNESSDSTNLYFVNGLMESTLNNLQKIEDLLVISRSSVERFRVSDKTIPEIAEELKVNYFVTGSGQKIGDQVLLNIQLIEASSERQIWAEQYNRELVDIFELQNEVARKISGAIEAIVTPAELEQIGKKPTENLLAYDYYLQALDPFLSRTNEGLTQAIGLFELAVEEDPEFSLAYANIAISYYLLEMYQAEKQYTEEINSYADKALLYDPTSDASLIAKAFYYVQTKEYQLALPHLEKALEYNPNSSLAVQMLADFYFRLVPNSDKYLEYALKGVQLNLASDSITQSYIYLQLGNALVQNGFVEEAVMYINKSLLNDPANYYSPYVKILVSYARDRDIESTTSQLEQEWRKDTTRLDILQDVANFHYYQEDYERAYFYFEKFIAAKEKYGLDIYPHEDLKIAIVYQELGLDEQAIDYFNSYADQCKADQSIYKSASLASQYAQEGKNDQAIEQLKIFATQRNYQYWILVFMAVDPALKPLKNHPEYQGVIQQIEVRFWENQAVLRASLEEKGLI